jgi:hypothetical protein
MNTPEDTTPPLPPEPPFQDAPPKPRPPDERFALRPMEGPPRPLAVVETLLKSPGRILFELRGARASVIGPALLAIGFLCLMVYGVVTGSLAGGNQLWIAPAKMLLGSALCALICLPSLFIFLCLGGADAKLRSVAGNLLASATLTSLLLLGFAPVAWVFSQSTDSVGLMAVLHLTFWAIALVFGLRLIGGGSRTSKVWIVIYTVVCLQMMTALRPIVGKADTFLPGEKKFFLVHLAETLHGQPLPMVERP